MDITNGGAVLLDGSMYIAAVANSQGTVTANGLNALGASRLVCQRPHICPAPHTGLFIGCTADSNGVGGKALANVEAGGLIAVENFFDAPGVIVGLSGTLAGNGTVAMHATGTTCSTLMSEQVKVFGTLAPTRTLTIQGNLLLDNVNATTVFNVKRLASDSDSVSVTDDQDEVLGGSAILGGRLLVIITDTDLTPGTTYTLLHTDAGRGHTQFATESIKYPANRCYIPEIQYTTAVPPATAEDVLLYLKPTYVCN